MEHSTNYFDTFIQVAADCPVTEAEAPPDKDPKSAARITWEMLDGHPYEFTSDQVLYAANGARRGISESEFFAKGQPCMRSSPLTKRYGWGVHNDAEGRLAIVAVHSPEYDAFANDTSLRQLRGMRSARK